MLIDHAYAELGLTAGASEAEVKAAWRRLVSQWHPDRNQTASALGRMQRINTAYEQIRLMGFEPGSPAANDTADEPAAPPPARRGRTICRRVGLTLEEAALGCVKVLRGKVTEACGRCDGRGHRVLAGACGVCGGHGVVRHHAWYGWVSTMATCGACHGERVARQVCDGCEGAGRLTRTYRHTVRIPAGVRHADVLYAAEGDGAFELHVELSTHRFFVLDDDGILRCEMPVDGFAWMANRWVDVPTLTGVQQMRLRRGHHVYRLRGQGRTPALGPVNRYVAARIAGAGVQWPPSGPNGCSGSSRRRSRMLCQHRPSARSGRHPRYPAADLQSAHPNRQAQRDEREAGGENGPVEHHRVRVRQFSVAACP